MFRRGLTAQNYSVCLQLNVSLKSFYYSKCTQRSTQLNNNEYLKRATISVTWYPVLYINCLYPVEIHVASSYILLSNLSVCMLKTGYDSNLYARR